MMSRSSWRPSPLAWASTSPTCASSCTTICPRASRAIIRKSGAPGAMACPRIVSCSTAMRTSPRSAISSTRKKATRNGSPLHIWTPSCVTPKTRLTCRRKPLLNYFGEAYAAENCSNCDNCTSAPTALTDITIMAQKFLSCVKRTDENFGAGHIADVLRGSKNEKVLRWGMTNSPPTASARN